MRVKAQLLLAYTHAHCHYHHQTASLSSQRDTNNNNKTNNTILPTDAASRRLLWDPGIGDAFACVLNPTVKVFQASKPYVQYSPRKLHRSTSALYFGIGLPSTVESKCCRVLLNPNPILKQPDAQRHTTRYSSCYCSNHLSIHPSSCAWYYTRQCHPSIRPSCALSYGRVGVRSICIEQHKWCHVDEALNPIGRKVTIEPNRYQKLEVLIATPVEIIESLNTSSTVNSKSPIQTSNCCRVVSLIPTATFSSPSPVNYGRRVGAGSNTIFKQRLQQYNKCHQVESLHCYRVIESLDPSLSPSLTTDKLEESKASNLTLKPGFQYTYKSISISVAVTDSSTTVATLTLTEESEASNLLLKPGFQYTYKSICLLYTSPSPRD